MMYQKLCFFKSLKLICHLQGETFEQRGGKTGFLAFQHRVNFACICYIISGQTDELGVITCILQKKENRIDLFQ